MSDEQKQGSFDPENFTEGGYFDDKDCTIVKAEIVEFDYAGKADAICALAVTLREDGNDDDSDDRTEYYKIGELSKFTPSADRKHYVPVGSVVAMNKTGKAALFLKALKEKGFEMSKLAKGIDGLEGLHGHVNIIPMPEMKGIDKKDLKILIFTKLTEGPATTAVKGAKTAKKKADAKGDATETKVASPAAAASVGGAEDKAQEVIIGLISAKGGKINKSAIPQAMFAEIKDAPLRNACIALGGKVDWLSAEDRPWTYNGGELSFGG